MKKTAFSLAAIAASLLFAQGAMAGCADWVDSAQLHPGDNPVTYYFIPNKAGNHEVKYHDSVNVSGTKVTFWWSNNNGASWNLITEDKEVTQSTQSEWLSAGSSNITFRFRYYNGSQYDVQTFSFRRCIN